MSRSPRLEELLALVGEDALSKFWTALPGRVAKFDADTCVADVQPLTMAAYQDEAGDRQIDILPVVPWCPVFFAGGLAGRLTIPVKINDLGLLILTSCSLDQLQGASPNESNIIEVVDPIDDSRNTLSSGIFLHGGFSTLADPPAQYSSDDIVLAAEGETKIRLGAENANEAVLQGNSFASNMQAFFTALNTWGLAVASALNTLGQPVPWNGPGGPGQAIFTVANLLSSKVFVE